MKFCDIQNDESQGKCYQPSRRPRLITLVPRPSLFWISQKTNLIIIIVLSYIVFKKIRTNTASRNTV